MKYGGFDLKIVIEKKSIREVKAMNLDQLSDSELATFEEKQRAQRKRYLEMMRRREKRP